MAYFNRVKNIIGKLNNNFLEKDEIIRLCLLAFFANKSIFLYGTSGVAKSMIVERISQAFKDTPHFSYLINHFAVSTIINEKAYIEDNKNIKAPLEGVICTVNELSNPNQNLETLFDRVLIRCKVVPIKYKENFESLLQGEFNASYQPLDEAFSLEELQSIFVKSQKVKFSKEALDLMHKLREQIEYHNQNIEYAGDFIYVSDRRYRQISELLKVCVYLNDRKKITVYDLALLKHCLWSSEKDQEVLDNILQDVFRKSIDDTFIKAKNNLKSLEDVIKQNCYTKAGKLKKIKANVRNDFLNKLYDFTKSFNELKQSFKESYQNLKANNNNIFLIEESYSVFFNAYSKIFEDIEQELVKIQQIEQEFKRQIGKKVYSYIPKTKKELKDLVNDFSVDLAKIDISNVSDFSYLFEDCKRKDFSGLEKWDVSHVTNMSSMFKNAKYFNHPIGNWNVSNVTNMYYMFCWASSFNQPLNNWDVSNVTNMGSMFVGTKYFNQPLNNWNVSNVKNMGFMFWFASSFNQPLNNWDVSNVTSMDCMFSDASSFNQPLNNWDVSNVKNMGAMFLRASSFNQPLNNWNVSHVTDMGSMFKDASSFNQPLNNWDVSRVISMSSMFAGASSFNQPLNSWDVSRVVSMCYMFCNASSFNQPLNNWDVSNVTNMNCMFWGTESFNQVLDKWNTSKVTITNISYMFSGSAQDPLPSWYKY